MRVKTTAGQLTFETPAKRCPGCGVVQDAATALRHDDSPKAGHLSVCIDCGAFLVFGAGLELELLSDAAFADLPAELQAQLNRMRAVLRSGA